MPPHGGSLRRLCRAVRLPPALVRSLPAAVAAGLTDRTVPLEHQWARVEPRDALLAGGGAAAAAAGAQLCVHAVREANAAWLAGRVPDLVVLHLLSTFWLVDDAGNVTTWCDALD